MDCFILGVTPFEDNLSAILSPIEDIRAVNKDTLIAELC